LRGSNRRQRNEDAAITGEKTDETILWLSHAGITTRTVGDTWIVFDVLGELRPQPEATPNPRVGVADNFSADDEIARAFEVAVEVGRTLGYPLVRASAPLDMPAFGDLRSIDADRRTIAQRAFRNIDVLLLPTTATAVPAVEAAKGKPQALSPSNTMFANYFGLPAISVPCGFDSHGLPVGLQIVGKPSDEATVLQVAREFETAASRS